MKLINFILANILGFLAVVVFVSSGTRSVNFYDVGKDIGNPNTGNGYAAAVNTHQNLGDFIHASGQYAAKFDGFSEGTYMANKQKEQILNEMSKNAIEKNDPSICRTGSAQEEAVCLSNFQQAQIVGLPLQARVIACRYENDVKNYDSCVSNAFSDAKDGVALHWCLLNPDEKERIGCYSSSLLENKIKRMSASSFYDQLLKNKYFFTTLPNGKIVRKNYTKQTLLDHPEMLLSPLNYVGIATNYDDMAKKYPEIFNDPAFVKAWKKVGDLASESEKDSVDKSKFGNITP